jgi:hypothetical protein
MNTTKSHLNPIQNFPHYKTYRHLNINTVIHQAQDDVHPQQKHEV